MNLAMALRPSTPAAVPTTIEDTRWKQVLDRDAGTGFVYGVQSTGIFCRPSCPSRRPDRTRVRFFDTTAEAAAAGFRACKRCRPTERPHDRFAEPVSRAAAYLAAHSDETVTLDELARITKTSPFSLCRRTSSAFSESRRKSSQRRRSWNACASTCRRDG
jgi:AraC family transcriptional regulator of adaptative response/methylated-DNA-[protein]-cysteine methyltransferase